MPTTLNLDDRDGWFDLNLKRGAEVVTIALDLYAANNSYAAIVDKYPSDLQPVEQAEAWVKWLEDAGVPEGLLTHGDAFRVAAEVIKAVGEFKKKHGLDSATPDSPASTDSPSPD